MIKVGSDFSGVGAFNQALMRLGIEYDEIFACDMDKYARETFIHNYGKPKYYPKDVYEREIPKESLDIYMTSPPCQAFSMSGKRLGKEDSRGVLFFNSHEFIKKNRPRYFIFENVKGLLSHDSGNTFNEWVNMLGGKSVNGLPVIFPYEDSVPYHIYYKVMNAKKYGVPQNRERVFIIGVRDDQDNYFRWAKEEPLNKRLKDILELNVDSKYVLSEKMNQYLSKCNNSDYVKVKSANKKGYEIARCGDSINLSVPKSDTRRGRVGKGVSQTLDTHCNQATMQGQEIRRLTPRECFRLMDFPDTFSWVCSDSQAYKQAGNSIVVRCLELIINNLIK
jgi:DNA (cytosine-5)-methyltransferase 1